MRTLILTVISLGVTAAAWAWSADATVDRIMEQYFVIQSSLAADSTKGIDVAAARIAKLASEYKAADPQSEKVFADVAKAAQGIQGKSLKEARPEFFELSKPLFVYLHQFYKGNKNYYRYFCSMEQKGWVQRDKQVRNPYLGSSMLTCGVEVP